MVMSTIDRLREQLAIPSPARPVPAEPNYPAPVSPGPRLFVPPADDGVLRYGDREPPDMPAPVLAHQYSWAGDSGKGHERHASPAISGAPDMPAPVLHHHASSHIILDGQRWKGLKNTARCRVGERKVRQKLTDHLLGSELASLPTTS